MPTAPKPPEIFNPKNQATALTKPTTPKTTLDPVSQKRQMPTVSQVHKIADSHTPRPKKPFLAKFLLPHFWGIWLAFALFLPLVYLPLPWQFKLGKHLVYSCFI